MKKEFILKNGYDFDRIIKNNKSYRYENYIIYIEYTTDDSYHFGISVGKKIGNAVTRNKVKRQLKNIISKKHYKNGFNCIIIVKKGILLETYDEMNVDYNNAIEKLNILKED